MALNEFLYPHHHVSGKTDPAQVAFEEQLEDFSQQVSYTCNLEIGGKLTPEDAFNRISTLWDQLQRSKQCLDMGQAS